MFIVASYTLPYKIDSDICNLEVRYSYYDYQSLTTPIMPA